ncbi:Non-specific serine/threonine protein kinase [Sulfidibacter corallicola]|uniref:Protein kinase n=1 Tax=Sulfidibacter corallicola TaxID=2818388 RepID=A0A8A4TWI5_SULCO|nr:serine/threonine-protein kinase [Sulfidibacter corallicola]QTD54326.1 protein kinase [Sulfidibacter corallicola]
MIQVGSQLGRFQVVERIGQGASGEVFRGYDDMLARPVALKVLRRKHRMTRLGRTRFLREARALSTLNHPSICSIYDFLEIDREDLLILEYIDGESMKHRLERESEVALATRLDWALQLVEAMAVAHQANIVHRDLKPDNLLITKDDRLKILDFGLAVARDAEPEEGERDRDARAISLDPNETHHGTLLGTLAYMAPEQARGERATTASDVYALGLVLQELFTGESAYVDTQNVGALLNRVERAETRPIDGQALGLDGDLVRLVERMTQEDSRLRPTAGEAGRLLRQIAQEPRTKRRRFQVVTTVLVTLALMVASYGLALLHRSESRSADVPRTRVIAFLPVANYLPENESAWVRYGLLEMVREGFPARADTYLIESERLERAWGEAAPVGHDQLDAERIRRLGRALGANIFVAADLSRRGRAYRLEYGVYTRSGLVFDSSAQSEDFSQLTTDVTRDIALKLGYVSEREDSSFFPSIDPIASQVYGAGLHQYLVEGPRVARHYFQVCYDRDPTFLQALYYLGRCELRLGDSEAAERYFHQVLPQARARGDRLLVADCLHQIARIDSDAAEFTEAEKLFEESMTIYRELGNLNGVAKIHLGLAMSHYTQGDERLAEIHGRESWLLRRRTGNAHDEGVVINFLGIVAMDGGRLELAEQRFKEARRIFQDINQPQFELLILGNLGLVAKARGDFGEAERLMNISLELSERTGDSRNTLLLQSHLADLKAARGQTEEALSIYRKVLERASKMSNEELVVTALASMAGVHLDLGEISLAGACLERVGASSVYIQDHYETLFVLGRYQASIGEREAALTTLERAKREAKEAWSDTMEDFRRELASDLGRVETDKGGG